MPAAFKGDAFMLQQSRREVRHKYQVSLRAASPGLDGCMQRQRPKIVNTLSLYHVRHQISMIWQGDDCLIRRIPLAVLLNAGLPLLHALHGMWRPVFMSWLVDLTNLPSMLHPICPAIL